jgi:hypothetical protein
MFTHSRTNQSVSGVCYLNPTVALGASKFLVTEKTAAKLWDLVARNHFTRGTPKSHVRDSAFLLQNPRKRKTCTESVPYAGLARLARRLQNAFAWLNSHHALTAFNFHYHSYDD